MASTSPLRFVRAKPLLGTTVEIRVEDMDEAAAHAAIDRGFAAVADIHRLMSFHDAGSDVSRLNRDAAAGPVTVDARTFEVLARAQAFAEQSDGLFDITAAARLVAWGFLPAPAGAPAPATDASWRDIVLEDANRVRFRKPLWLDLGGIAKGYAVDHAVAATGGGGQALVCVAQVCVNAGGDLRIAGPRPEPVRLRTALVTDAVPVVELEDGALACSSGREHMRAGPEGLVGPHVHGRSGVSVGMDRFAAVAATDCLTADALTKVVLALGPGAEPILGQCGAIAYLYEPGSGWITLGADQG